MSAIYVVHTTTGLYDSTNQYVCAYIDQNDANEHVRHAQRFANKILHAMQLWREFRGTRDTFSESTYLNGYGYPKDEISPYDLNMCIWDDFIRYYVVEIPLYTQLTKLGAQHG